MKHEMVLIISPVKVNDLLPVCKTFHLKLLLNWKLLKVKPTLNYQGIESKTHN